MEKASHAPSLTRLCAVKATSLGPELFASKILWEQKKKPPEGF